MFRVGDEFTPEQLRPNRRFRGNVQDLEQLRSAFEQGDSSIWHSWRRRNRHRSIDLSGVDLGQADLRHVDLRSVRLVAADFSGANANARTCEMRGTDLRRASLWHIDLSYADLAKADLRKAELVNATVNEADLRGANLRGADLERAQLNGVDFRGAKLRGAKVAGASVWDITTDSATEQEGLVVRAYPPGSGDPNAWAGTRPPPSYPHLTVDDIEVAHFVGVMLCSNKIARILEASTNRTVLLLGRFTPARRRILDTLRERLLEIGYAPLVFDFPRVPDRDLIETITMLAGLSKFVIADVTAPRSTPLESQAIVPDLAVPFVPIIREGERPFSMLADLQRKYDWVMPTLTYRDGNELARHLERGIVAPALATLARLTRRRRESVESIQIRHAARRLERS